MDRPSRILLRAALALPMLYGAWSLRPLLNEDTLLAFYSYLPAFGLLLGAALVLAGWNARWAWVIVAASGLWIASMAAYPYGLSVSGFVLFLRYPPAPAAIGVYGSILALSFILRRREDAKEAALGRWSSGRR